MLYDKRKCKHFFNESSGKIYPRYEIILPIVETVTEKSVNIHKKYIYSLNLDAFLLFRRRYKSYSILFLSFSFYPK